MDVMIRGHISLRIQASKFWNMPLISLLDHLNGRKLGPKGVLNHEEDKALMV
jgi:hypothetical protein